MNTFTVYPKEGESFTLHCERFQLRERRFILYGAEGEEPTDQAFLSANTVAAIIPEHQRQPASSVSLKNFRLYLRNRRADKPILVTASSFDAEHQPNVVFYLHSFGPGESKPRMVSDVYVASSEVVPKNLLRSH
jgi:hypothetical protein